MPVSLFPAIRAAILMIAVLLALPAGAASRGLLRDAGMEHGLNLLAQPLLLAAGLPATRTKILVVDDMSMNAFVVDSSHVFIHAGLLLRMKTAAELQAVMAHEIAHIANGHFARRALNLQSTRTITGLGIALAVATGAAAGNAELGAGLVAGSLSSAQRAMFSHTRAEEAAADQSAMRYLASAGIEPIAMRGVLDIFEGQESLNVGTQDKYAQSHPLTRDRMRAVDQYAAALKPRETDQTQAEYWFGRAQGKLSAYLRSPSYTLDRLRRDDTSDAALIQRAVALFRKPDLAGSRAQVRDLLARHPDDAYLFDLSGWIEIDSGQVGPAVAAYARAAELAPREPMILSGYGRALLAQDTTASRATALQVLERARALDPFDARMLRDLSLAYAKAGQNGMASLSTAERYALQGKLDDAGLHARRAAGLLPTGSPGWSRAQDIIRVAEAGKKRR